MFMNYYGKQKKVKAKSDLLLSTQVKLTVLKSSWPKKKLGQTMGRENIKDGIQATMTSLEYLSNLMKMKKHTCAMKLTQNKFRKEGKTNPNKREN